MAHLVLASTDPAEPMQDLNRAPSPTQTSKMSPSPPSSPPCTCKINRTNSFLEHAKTMKEAMQNKTTLLSKIRHRTTHSYEAIWASVSLSLVVTLLVIGVLHSKMWQHRPHVSSMDSQPIKFIQWNPMAEIKVGSWCISNLTFFFSAMRRYRTRVSESVSQSVSRSVGQSVSRSVGQSVSQSV